MTLPLALKSSSASRQSAEGDASIEPCVAGSSEAIQGTGRGTPPLPNPPPRGGRELSDLLPNPPPRGGRELSDLLPNPPPRGGREPSDPVPEPPTPGELPAPVLNA